MARVTMLGRLADAAGWRERTVEAGTLAELKAALRAAHGGLELDGPTVFVAVNDALVRGDVALRADDEVAFMPPMSGG